MQNIDWIQEYIHRIFNIDLVKQGLELRNDKLKYINLLLYKYCSINEESSKNTDTIDYNINNFENEILYFQNPNKFNDPFDCFLGFSQSQILKSLLTYNLQKKRQFTPQNRKALEALFDNNDANIVEFEELKKFVYSIIPHIQEDDDVKSASMQFIDFIFNQDDEKIKRLINNTFTMKDKQDIVDFLYCNETFRNLTKKNIKTDDLDSIIKIASQSMKIKIENDPDFFLSEKDGLTFGIIDLLRLLSNKYSEDFSVDELNSIKEKFNDVSKETLQKGRNIISEQFRITCLSERMDSPLMWSHYANKHYGFCLEYDFSQTLTTNLYPDLLAAQIMLFPVIYSDIRPLLSKALFSSKTLTYYYRTKKIPPNFAEQLIYGLLFKSEDWSYEKEWRILQIKSKEPIMKLPKARRVFLGANIEDNAKHRIIDIAQKKHIPVFQMFLNSDKYKFDFYQIK